MGEFDIPKQGKRLAKWCCDLLSTSEQLAFILFTLIQTFAMLTVIKYARRALAALTVTRNNTTTRNISLPAARIAHSLVEDAYWQVLTSWGCRHISPFYVFFAITNINFGIPEIPVVALTTLSVVVAIYCISIALEDGCMPFSDNKTSILVLTYSSIVAGVSMAYFVVLITNLYTLLYTVIYNALRIPPLLAEKIITITSKIIISFAVDILLAGMQLLIVLFFSRNEANIMGGNLTIVSIGVLAVSMGLTLPAALAALPHSIAAQYSNMAGALVGSGLTLIAIGLQWYYEKQSHRNSLT